MIQPKNILVVNTHQLDGIKIEQYLKPISAHIVTGTNLFSDMAASLTDIFGGRSESYQKQITTIYNEAIEKLKMAAFEIGANCIVGLHIDMDEIAGKGKSMFMLTAIGTAVIINEQTNQDKNRGLEKNGIAGLDRIKILQKKRSIISKAKSDSLIYDDELWEFITQNTIIELYTYILNRYVKLLKPTLYEIDVARKFQNQLASFVDSFTEDEKIDLIYTSIFNVEYRSISNQLMNIIERLQLLDIDKVIDLLNDDDFFNQKQGLQILTYDKPFYTAGDLPKLEVIKQKIKENFKERGKRTTKKQMLSSKEKDIWICECGKTNDNEANRESYCESCGANIYGFRPKDVSDIAALHILNDKITDITELTL